MAEAFGLAGNWSPDALIDAIDEALRTGVCITDGNGRFVAVSQGYCRIYGYEASALIGQPFTMVVPEAMRAEAQALHRRFLETGVEVPEEWQVEGAGGRRLWVRVGAARFFDQDGNPFKVTTVEDVTARREAELALTEANQELERLNQAKDRLFSIIGHDLRSPFNPIMSYADMLQHPAGPMTTTQVAEYAANIREAATSAMGLLDNLLGWARLQMERAVLEPVDCPVAPLAAAALGDLEAVMERKALTVTQSLEGVCVRADPFMLRTALRNLLSNAAKFTPRGGRISLAAAPAEPGWAAFAVADTGVGMPPGTLDSLFGEGQAVTRLGTENESGTGTGVRIVREMVARNGGTVSARSTPGEGTTFVVTLPAGEPAAD